MFIERPLTNICDMWRSSSAGASVIPADGCVDVILHAKRLWLAGPSTRAINTWADGEQPSLGIRLAPGQAWRLLAIQPAELRDVTAPLDAVVGTAAAAALGRLLAAQAAAPEAPLVAAALGAGSTTTDRWVRYVRQAASANRRAGRLVAELGWSERKFRRQMAARFGYGYTTLVRIERARAARAMITGGTPLAAVAAASGYADQAHMTREFSRLVGRTPGQLAASGA